MTPTASVVIPCFNVADTINQQLASLIPQLERAGAELILVDNKSTDTTGAILHSLSSRPDVTVARADAHQGVAYARNVGVSFARSDRLLFCDADDVVNQDWVELLLKALDDNDIVTGSLDTKSLNGASLRRSRGASDGPASFYGLFPLAHGGNMAVTRAAWNRIGPLDESLIGIEDMEWSLRAQETGHTIVRAPDAVVQYRYRSSPGDLWRQGLSYGRHRPLVARMTYETLGTRPRPLAGVRSWAWLVCNIGRIGSVDGRARLAWVAGNRFGNLVGSAQARFLLL